MADDSFDAVVVGAGPAGCACAYTLAKQGKNVLLVERGNSAGAKNVSGGRLYTYALQLVEPGMYLRAPMQRKIVREQVMMLGEKSAITVDYCNYEYADGVPQSYSVIRASLDEWFAGEAEAQGATLATGQLVDGLVEEGHRIVGIKVGGDEIRAKTVVAADGVNSLLAQKAGLFAGATGGTVGVGVKENIELPDAIISQRFAVKDEEGTARVAIGCTEGICGGAFLYTNRGSISLGIVFNPEQAARQGRHLQDIFQDFKMHPAILPLIEGGRSVEFGAHLVPEAGYDGIPKQLYREGMLVAGDAAQFGINTGLIIRGMDLAIVSGLAAANAILIAKSAAETGPLYMKQLEELSVLPNMRAFSRFHNLFEISRIFKEYPALANELMQFLFTVNGRVPPPMLKQIVTIFKNNVAFGQIATDAWKAYRSI